MNRENKTGISKKRVSIILLLAITMTSLGQIRDSLYIYKGGVTISRYAIANIDSITFIPPSKTSNNEINHYNYSLVESDYLYISSSAQTIAANGNEFDFAKAIGANKLFYDTVSAVNYIPLLLSNKYPNTASLSTALISYKFYSPCDTSKLASTNKYTLTSTDYDAMGVATGLPGFYDSFSSTIDPSFYIPIWLKINNPYAKINDIKLVRYKYLSSQTTTQKFTVFQFNGTDWVVYNTTKQTSTKFKFENNKWLSCNILNDLNDGIGNFKAINVLGAQTWGWSPYKFMLMTGYNSGSYYSNEDWLVSPAMNFTDRLSPYLIFSHVGRYFGDVSPSKEKMKIAITVWASTKSDGDSINSNDWEQLTIPDEGYPSGNNWTFISSTPISLAKYAGQANVRIAFKYQSNSTDNAAGSWEIKNVSIYEE